MFCVGSVCVCSFKLCYKSRTPQSQVHQLLTERVTRPHFSSLQTIMKDKWMNIGYEDEELRPYAEPEPDLNDPIRMRKS